MVRSIFNTTPYSITPFFTCIVNVKRKSFYIKVFCKKIIYQTFFKKSIINIFYSMFSKAHETFIFFLKVLSNEFFVLKVDNNFFIRLIKINKHKD